MNAESIATQAPSGVFRVSREGPNGGPGGGGAMHDREVRAPGSVGLWAFIGVVTSLFSLFLVAFAMRMDSPDWHRVALPWQVWLSTGLLAAASVAMQVSTRAARAGQMERARRALRLGGLGAAAFVASQLWAWQALYALHVVPANNPAGSFFYLLTAMHGLHVVGGLVAFAYVAMDRGSGTRTVTRIGLCTRYWHFLLALWIVLLGALGWLTPEIVRYICGTA
ncbi:cytochrome c oxidase subunit 3 [Cupriavidus sp. OV038]|jgi:cytochrome c oxidase subunit 3|uniref:bb3-type cytochrome oxidase subunit III n=1 Tax=unclassified Cupriavidus TaxID=2640874 RepID=UPI0008EB286D|nr:cytochrome c oxidase subunit 3 [Cupriavidus sp. OV038]SFP26996.1 cytochrome c oxidase subunit 3 [Cupriavidus sp. OV096]